VVDDGATRSEGQLAELPHHVRDVVEDVEREVPMTRLLHPRLLRPPFPCAS